jgi:hypothetical protein
MSDQDGAKHPGTDTSRLEPDLWKSASARTPQDADDLVYEYEWDKTRPASIAVVNAVAEVKETDPLDLPPLQQYLDGDALNAVETWAESENSKGMIVSFLYHGLRVTIGGGETIRLRHVNLH